jgi:hypothetical protein
MTTTTTATTTAQVEPGAGHELRLAAAAEHMSAAESFLHTTRQAGIDEWTSVAHQLLHDAIAEHARCLLEPTRG